MTSRRIAKIFKSIPAIEGAGVHVKRAFGYSQVPQFDPFLMLDDFHTSNPDEYLAGFPWHPHRGIETITYVLEGLVEHGDSMGSKGSIGAGDVHWMTSGSGIIHQEMPQESPTGSMFVSGKPLGEPVAWHRPIVMNTPEELRIAFEEYQDGTFVKKALP